MVKTCVFWPKKWVVPVAFRTFFDISAWCIVFHNRHFFVFPFIFAQEPDFWFFWGENCAPYNALENDFSDRRRKWRGWHTQKADYCHIFTWYSPIWGHIHITVMYRVDHLNSRGSSYRTNSISFPECSRYRVDKTSGTTWTIWKPNPWWWYGLFTGTLQNMLPCSYHNHLSLV